MEIESIKSIAELEHILKFVSSIFPQPEENREKYNYTRDFWLDKMEKNADLLLYAKNGDQIIASVFAWIDNNEATIAHFCVDEEWRNKQIGASIMTEIESRIKKQGYNLITLGSLESAEGFYEKMGYTGSLLIQSEKTSIEELLSMNEQYNIAWTNIYDNKINQVCLNLPKPDRELQEKYEHTFIDCHTQMIFQKNLSILDIVP
jgi:GNAT superfamily N-acetyltransferase